MSLLLVVASVEYHDAESQRMWQPVEESPDPYVGWLDARLSFGDNGSPQIFICDTCLGRPITSLIQGW